MWINFLKPTNNTQTTWKTIRGMVTKNLIALMLTGHPLGLIENMIHTPIDWVVNKNFCTDNKLLNIWVHLATCLSVDSLIHGTGHEIAEVLTSDGWGHVHGSVYSDMMTNSDLSLSSTTDVSDMMTDSITDIDVAIDQPEVSELSSDATVSETQQPVVESSVTQSSSTDSPMKKILEQKARSMSKMMEMVWDGDISPSELVQIHQAADAQWLIDHTWHHHIAWDGHIHTAWDGHMYGDIHTDHGSHAGHDHEHGWHGILPILWWAIVEEYGPTMYKITKKRTQWLLSRMFNYDTGSDIKIVKKSELATA